MASSIPGVVLLRYRCADQQSSYIKQGKNVRYLYFNYALNFNHFIFDADSSYQQNHKNGNPAILSMLKALKRYEGFIRPNPGGSGPIKNEGFIEFKDDDKATPYKLSTSDLQAYVVGKDSFVVAHAPGQ
jgi:hypothetical protein